jgi:hypothetical protein
VLLSSRDPQTNEIGAPQIWGIAALPALPGRTLYYQVEQKYGIAVALSKTAGTKTAFVQTLELKQLLGGRKIGVGIPGEGAKDHQRQHLHVSSAHQRHAVDTRTHARRHARQHTHTHMHMSRAFLRPHSQERERERERERTRARARERGGGGGGERERESERASEGESARGLE